MIGSDEISIMIRLVQWLLATGIFYWSTICHDAQTELSHTLTVRQAVEVPRVVGTVN